jgi:hypothetical protein
MFLVVFLLAITMSWLSFCVPSCSPLGHRCGHPFMFMVAFLLAIAVVMVVFFCSWLHSSWPLQWPWFLVAYSWPSPQSSSCVPSCVPLGHHCGPNHHVLFLVVFLLAIIVAMVILLCSWQSSWSSSHVNGCIPLGHHLSLGHPLILLVVTFLNLLSLVLF